MPSFVQFLIRRFLLIPVSLLIITMVLYGGVMLTPPEARAELYMPKTNRPLTEEQIERIRNLTIERFHLRDPFHIQYLLWVKSLVQGSWGYSPSLKEDVLPALLRRTPVTLELALYSLLLFVPLGLVCGLVAGWKPKSAFDNILRPIAYISTSMPVFIFALLLMVIFYVNLHWFSPERISMPLSFEIKEAGFHNYTGLLSIDSLLNLRLDIFLDSLRHLFMPVLALSIYHWATLSRVIRATVMGERNKEYIVSARARGVSEQKVLWKHAFSNVLSPTLTSVGISAATILSGVFVVEIIFGFRGISEVLVNSISGLPDAPAALGFAVYSVIIILLLMFFIDVLQAVLDPRVREELLKS
jgi:ABC-type dipeptide/oligopeptide/nickel transport system permease component